MQFWDVLCVIQHVFFSETTLSFHPITGVLIEIYGVQNAKS